MSNNNDFINFALSAYVKQIKNSEATANNVNFGLIEEYNDTMEEITNPESELCQFLKNFSFMQNILRKEKVRNKNYYKYKTFDYVDLNGPKKSIIVDNMFAARLFKDSIGLIRPNELAENEFFIQPLIDSDGNIQLLCNWYHNKYLEPYHCINPFATGSLNNQANRYNQNAIISLPKQLDVTTMLLYDIDDELFGYIDDMIYYLHNTFYENKQYFYNALQKLVIEYRDQAAKDYSA